MNQTNAKMKVDPKNIDLKKLKELLEYGDAKTIAKKSGYAHSYVNLVLNPNNERYNAKIIIEAVELVKNRAKIELDPDVAHLLTKNGSNSVPKNGQD